MSHQHEIKSSDYDKYFAIWINATNDINPCQKMEILTEDWELVYLDSFKTFFKDPESAKSKYKDIFNLLKSTSTKTDSTKFTIYSHSTNIDDIRAWNTKEFTIKIVINQWDDEIRYNLWKLLSKQEIEKKLNEQWISYENLSLSNLWLNWILNWNDPYWYIYLFNSGIWWGTHNIASSIKSFSEIIKTKWFKIIAPNYRDDTKEYTSRTSLFLQEDNIKFCIRTDAKKEQLEIVNDIIQENQNFISDILVTEKKIFDYNESDCIVFQLFSLKMFSIMFLLLCLIVKIGKCEK